MQDLNLYRSVKKVHAKPMPLGKALAYTSNPIKGEFDAEGYLVVYNKDTPKQYISWSPKEEFEKGNVNLSGPISYSIALEECLESQEVLIARAGWNGKGMFVFLVVPDEDSVRYGDALPYLAMRTADGSVVPWLCSQTDMQACDWYIL